MVKRGGGDTTSWTRARRVPDLSVEVFCGTRALHPRSGARRQTAVKNVLGPPPHHTLIKTREEEPLLEGFGEMSLGIDWDFQHCYNKHLIFHAGLVTSAPLQYPSSLCWDFT